MTGSEHYATAEQIATAATEPHPQIPKMRVLRKDATPEMIALGQLHATLALAAAEAGEVLR